VWSGARFGVMCDVGAQFTCRAHALISQKHSDTKYTCRLQTMNTYEKCITLTCRAHVQEQVAQAINAWAPTCKWLQGHLAFAYIQNAGRCIREVGFLLLDCATLTFWEVRLQSIHAFNLGGAFERLEWFLIGLCYSKFGEVQLQLIQTHIRTHLHTHTHTHTHTHIHTHT